jgi:chromosome partitioning protein
VLDAGAGFGRHAFELARRGANVVALDYAPSVVAAAFTIDWIVVRNRTGHVEARNMARLQKALTEMAKRVGFRVTPGLSERVIYRELFPSGLTLLDKGHLGELGTSHLVARQELRSLVKALNLPDFARTQSELELA